MSYRARAFIILCLLALAVAVSRLLTRENGQNGEIELIISMNSNAFRLGDFPIINLEIKNLSTREILINSRLRFSVDPQQDYPTRSLSFRFISPSGEELSLGCRETLYQDSASLTTLRPGESIKFTKNTKDCYLLEEPGIYTVQAIYGNSFAPSDLNNVWIGVVDSNILKFEIFTDD